MSEEEPIGFSPENREAESADQILRRNAESLGFTETADLIEFRRQAMELSQTVQTEETERQFYAIMTQLQIAGEAVADQTPETGLAQTGLMIYRAGVLIECGRFNDALDELNDILDDLSYKAEGNPELQQMVDNLEAMYKQIKGK